MRPYHSYSEPEYATNVETKYKARVKNPYYDEDDPKSELTSLKYFKNRRDRDNQIIEFLKSGYNVSQCAFTFFVSRQTIYNIINKKFEDLKQRSEFINSLEKY